jgi:hypothetical protein
MKPDQRLVDAFYEATLWQIDQIKHHGWKKFTANFLREWARGKYAIPFSNSLSPAIMDEVLEQHPHLKRWIKVHKHAKGGKQPGAALENTYDFLDDDPIGPDDKEH